MPAFVVQNEHFRRFFQEFHQSVNQLGFRSGSALYRQAARQVGRSVRWVGGWVGIYGRWDRGRIGWR